MNHSQPDPIPSDLLKVVKMLHDERPEATPLELDRIKLRAKARAAQTRPSYFARQKGTLMRSRAAITSMLVAGMMMTGTGATLATSGSSGSGSASDAEYPKTTQPVTPQTTVTPPPAVQTLAPPPVQQPEQSTLPPIVFAPTPVEEAPEVRGQTEVSPRPAATPRQVAPANEVAPAAKVQPARQIVAAENELPFTGFAALPILIGGLVLLVTGFTLRRQARNDK